MTYVFYLRCIFGLLFLISLITHVTDDRRKKILEMGGAEELLNMLGNAKDDRTRKEALKALSALSALGQIHLFAYAICVCFPSLCWLLKDIMLLMVPSPWNVINMPFSKYYIHSMPKFGCNIQVWFCVIHE